MAAEQFLVLDPDVGVEALANDLCNNKMEIPVAEEVAQKLKDSIVVAGGGIGDLLRGLSGVVQDMATMAGDCKVRKEARDCAILVLWKLGRLEEREGFDSGIKQLSGETLFSFIDSLMAMLSSPYWCKGNTGFLMTGRGRLAMSVFARIHRDVISAVVGSVEKFSGSPSWHDHHAALAVVCQVAATSPEVLRDYLDQVVPVVLKFLRYPHCDVLPAVADTITVLGSHLLPTIQQSYGSQILPVLAGMIGDVKPTVKQCGAKAFGSFSKACTADIVMPFFTEIVSNLIGQLESGNEKAKGQTLTALASVASSSKGLFDSNLYDSTMLSLKAILVNKDTFALSLRARCLECISFVAASVGKDQFKKDATAVKLELIAVQADIVQAGMKETGYGENIYFLQALLNICCCLGDDFFNCVRHVIPFVILSAGRKDDLAELRLACKILSKFISQFERRFPWLYEVTGAFFPLLKHEDPEVKNSAISAMPKLLHIAVRVLDEGYSGVCWDMPMHTPPMQVSRVLWLGLEIMFNLPEVLNPITSNVEALPENEKWVLNECFKVVLPYLPLKDEPKEAQNVGDTVTPIEAHGKFFHIVELLPLDLLYEHRAKISDIFRQVLALPANLVATGTVTRIRNFVFPVDPPS